MARATAGKSDGYGETGFQERFNRQVETARGRLTSSVENARERVGEAQGQAIDVWDDAVDYVRENPGRIIAISLGMGLALGAYLRFGRG